MRCLHRILLVGFLLSATATTSAQQVYETTDAEGNPVFSDTPSESSVSVEVAPANSADAVDPRPAQAPADDARAGVAPAAPSPVDEQQRLDRLMKEYEADQDALRAKRDGLQRNEVGHDASEVRDEVGHGAGEKREKREKRKNY